MNLLQKIKRNLKKVPSCHPREISYTIISWEHLPRLTRKLSLSDIFGEFVWHIRYGCIIWQQTYLRIKIASGRESAIIRENSMTQKNTNTANRYMDNNNKRGFWFRDNARDRRLTVELTRNSDGTYFVHGAKAHYTQGQSKRAVTINPRELKKELRSAAVTPCALQTH